MNYWDRVKTALKEPVRVYVCLSYPDRYLSTHSTEHLAVQAASVHLETERVVEVWEDSLDEVKPTCRLITRVHRG